MIEEFPHEPGLPEDATASDGCLVVDDRPHSARRWNRSPHQGLEGVVKKCFEADKDVIRYVRPVSRFGLIARGVVFIQIALLLAVSGSAYQAVDPPGMKEALDALQKLTGGWLAARNAGSVGSSKWRSTLGLELACP